MNFQKGKKSTYSRNCNIVEKRNGWFHIMAVSCFLMKSFFWGVVSLKGLAIYVTAEPIGLVW